MAKSKGEINNPPAYLGRGTDVVPPAKRADLLQIVCALVAGGLYPSMNREVIVQEAKQFLKLVDDE
jgi:heme/copper-type cytochrome/quinol oxidase subunit 2